MARSAEEESAFCLALANSGFLVALLLGMTSSHLDNCGGPHTDRPPPKFLWRQPLLAVWPNEVGSS